MFDDAQVAIVTIAESLASTIDRLKNASNPPKTMQVEFGLTFSSRGSVLVTQSSSDATLRVTIGYESKPDA